MATKDAQYDTFEKVKKYLSEHESDIQNGLGANTFADMAFFAFLRMANRYGIGYSPQFSFMQGDQFTQMTPVAIQNRFSQHIYDQYMDDQKSFERFMREQETISQNIEELYKKFESEIDPETFTEFIDEHMSWWAIGIIGEDKGRLAHEDLLSILSKKGMSKAEAEEALGILTHIESISDLMKPQIAEFKIRKAIEEGKDVGEMIEAYIEKYFFFRTTLRDREVMTVDQLREEFSGGTPLHEEKEEADLGQQQDDLLRELDFSDEELRRIEFLKRMVVWVDKRRVTYMKHNYYLFDVLHKIADQFSLLYETIALYSFEDIIELLKTKQPLSENEVARRKAGFFVVYEIDQPRKYFYGEEAKQLLAIARQPSHLSQVEGMVASKGVGEKISGRVRIIQSETEPLLEKDEVLVTSMTRPEFVKYMKDAAAIVTDEGGIACHAAIVSREMGKLCVIGTKHATQIFKDGDMIEVDPETGVVKTSN